MHAVRKLSVWYKIPIWFQNTVCPKTKDAFPKIQAWAYNRYSRLHRSRVLRKYQGVFKRYHDGWQPRKRRMEKWIHIFSVSIMIIPARLLCQMQANSSGTEFLSTISKFIKRNIILSLLVYVLHKTWNQAFSRGSRAVTAKTCRKKPDARAKLFFLPCCFFCLFCLVFCLVLPCRFLLSHAAAS